MSNSETSNEYNDAEFLREEERALIAYERAHGIRDTARRLAEIRRRERGEANLATGVLRRDGKPAVRALKPKLMTPGAIRTRAWRERQKAGAS